jgi:hypothetical protein
MNEQKMIGNDPYHSFSVGPLANLNLTYQIDTFAVGHNANAMESHSFAFGDHTTTNREHQIVVGTHLFGEEIPQAVRDWVVQNPEQMKDLIRAICKCRTTNEFTGDIFVVKWFADAFYKFTKEDREASNVDR